MSCDPKQCCGLPLAAFSRISSSELGEIIGAAKDYAYSNGICMRLKGSTSSDTMEHAPFTLLPSEVPRTLFQQAYDVHKDMSLLYHKIAFDFDVLYQNLKCIAERDEFTRNLLDIYVKLKDEGLVEKTVALTIQRSDYMFHQPAEFSQISANNNAQLSLKQVEVNNIASSFAALSTRITGLHKYIVKRFCDQLLLDPQRIPNNNALHTVARGLVEAWKYYNDNIGENGHVLFVLEEVNRNIIDQRAIEEEILVQAGYQLKIIRLTLRECSKLLHLEHVDRKLTLKSNSQVEIGVIYFRTGYVPQQYQDAGDWEIRLQMELSRAIKCPWIGAHLAGTKKIQQILAGANFWRERLPSFEKSDAAQKIRKTFVGLYGLEKSSPDTERIIQEACTNPNDFVLKPQLEGGGNNFYGPQLKQRLLEMTSDQREVYVLMDRIHPKIVKNRPIRSSQPVVEDNGSAVCYDMVSEMGTFGYLLSDGPLNVITNYSDGHLLRTKMITVDEGGVMAGASALDSPYLVDE